MNNEHSIPIKKWLHWALNENLQHTILVLKPMHHRWLQRNCSKVWYLCKEHDKIILALIVKQ